MEKKARLVNVPIRYIKVWIRTERGYIDEQQRSLPIEKRKSVSRAADEEEHTEYARELALFTRLYYTRGFSNK